LQTTEQQTSGAYFFGTVLGDDSSAFFKTCSVS